MTDKLWDQGCALWFWQNFVMEFEVFDRENVVNPNRLG